MITQRKSRFTFSEKLLIFSFSLFIILGVASCSKNGTDEPDPIRGGIEKDGEFSITTNYLKDSIFYIADADLQKDGSIVFAGLLTSRSEQKVYRIDPNGKIDASFDIDKDVTWLIKNIRQVKVLDDGSVLVAGQFTVGGKTKHLIRLNSDGRLDRSFDAPAFSDRGNSDTSPILFLGLQNDGKIVLGGYFTSIGNSARQALGRLNANGTLDESFNFDPTVAYSVIHNVEFLQDGKMTASGEFLTTVNPRRYVTRLNANGSADQTFIFREQMGGGIPAPAVYKTATLPSGQILIGGFFGEITNPNVRDGKHLYTNFARLNSDGAPDLTFDKMSGIESWGSVKSIAPLPNGKILLGRAPGVSNLPKDSYLSITSNNGKLERNLKLNFKSGGVKKFLKVNDKKYFVVGSFGTQYEERTTSLLLIELK